MEKAVYRIEQEIKRSKTQSSQSEDERNAYHLQNLLAEAKGILPDDTHRGFRKPYRNSDHTLEAGDNQSHFRQPAADHAAEDQYAVDDAENPLQLLARASDLSGSPNIVEHSSNVTFQVSNQASLPARDSDLQSFFGPFRPSLDVGPDIDPIDMGLVTEEESASLFK